MVLLDEGLTELANQASSLLTKGQWGTGTTLPTASDTGLESATASTLLDLTGVNSGNAVQFSHTVPSNIANGLALTEFELQFANGDSFNRIVGAAINKTASFELTTITGVNFVRQG